MKIVLSLACYPGLQNYTKAASWMEMMMLLSFLQNWAERVFGVPVLNHWWQTESGSAITAACRGLGVRAPPPHSAGYPVPGYDGQSTWHMSHLLTLHHLHWWHTESVHVSHLYTLHHLLNISSLCFSYKSWFHNGNPCPNPRGRGNNHQQLMILEFAHITLTEI